MTWSIVQVSSTPKMELNCHGQSNSVQTMTKSRQDNNVTDHTGALYAKNETELSWPIRQGAVYDVE